MATLKEEETARAEARKSLERMQEFDVGFLPREAALGTTFNFRDAVAPARRLVDLYKRLTISVLDDLPVQQLTVVRNRANEEYSRFDNILKFDPNQNTPRQARDQLVEALVVAYEPAFGQLYPIIAYSLHKAADFQRLDSEARATLQGIKDNAEEITKDLEAQKGEGARILEDVRKLAGELGVTTQATFFAAESREHKEQAEVWRRSTMRWALALGVYAALSLFLHKLLAPANSYETAQLAISKVLIFGVLSYMVYLGARNFLANQHNAIVNKHRQNALLTYKALVDASGDPANREVILGQAAACIFSPQPTGYTRDGGLPAPGATSVIELISRSLKGSSE